MGFNKKGEQFASSMLGEWSLYIIGFVILLIFVGGLFLFLGTSNDDELCKLSVLSRATSPIGAAQQAIPLKCITKKICFNSGEGKCSEQFAGEKKIISVKIPEIKGVNDAENIKKAAEIIEETSAEKMYECWKIMGEGKLDLFNGVSKELGIEPAKSTCVICSRLAIDRKSVPDEVLRELGNQIDINEYLKTNPITKNSQLTYLQAFLDSRDVQGYAAVQNEVFASKESIDKKNDEIFDSLSKMEKERFKEIEGSFTSVQKEETAPNRELAFVFMQVKSVSIGHVLKNMAYVGATFAGSVFMTPVIKSIATRVIYTPVGGFIAIGASAGAAGYGAWNARQGQLTAASYCGDLTTNEKDAREGCSVVEGLNYNKDEINALCGSIQGRLYDIS